MGGLGCGGIKVDLLPNQFSVVVNAAQLRGNVIFYLKQTFDCISTRGNASLSDMS